MQTGVANNLASPAFRVAYDASVVDKPDCNRPLSSSDSSMKPLFCVRRVRCPRPQGRSPETAAFTLRDRSPRFFDRRPFLCRRSTFLCRRANFFCRRSTHAARPQHPPIRAYRRPDLPIPLPESAASSRPTLPPQPDSFATTSRPAFDHSQIGRGPQPDFGLVSSAHTANFCRSFLPPSGIYRPSVLVILPDSLWHTSRFALP